MKQSHIPVLVSAAAAVALLLLLIFWSSPAMEEADVRPGAVTEAGEVAHEAASAVTVLRFEAPDEWYAAGAKGESYAGALAGDEWRADTTTGALLGQSPPDGPYLPDYVVGRAYLGWDTSGLPEDAEVLSATLVLDLPAEGGRAAAFTVVVCRGDWTPPIDREAWNAPCGEVVGHWRLPASPVEAREMIHMDGDILLYALEPPRTVRISLDPGVIQAGSVTRLELRHAGEGVSPLAAEIVPLDPSHVRLEVEYRR
jgi:hypothetical protein